MEAPSFMRRPSAPVLAIRSEPGTKAAFAGNLTSRVDANSDLHPYPDKEAFDNRWQGSHLRQPESDRRAVQMHSAEMGVYADQTKCKEMATLQLEGVHCVSPYETYRPNPQA